MMSAEEARCHVEYCSMEQVLKQWEEIENSIDLAVSRGISRTLIWGKIHKDNQESLEELGYIVESGIDCYSIRWDEEAKNNGRNDSDGSKDTCNY